MSSNIMSIMLLKRWIRRDKRRARWIRPPRTRAFALLLALGLCSCSYADGVLGSSGTTAAFEGQVCGQDVSVKLVDKKDRTEAVFKVTCPGGAGLEFTSTDSSTSAVINAISQLAAQVAQLATRVAAPATGAAAAARSMDAAHARVPVLKPRVIEVDQL